MQDQHGQPLVLPVLYVSNRDLSRAIADKRLQCTYDPVISILRMVPCGPGPFPGIPWSLASCSQSSTAQCSSLPYNPDYVFGTVPDARRRFRQEFLSLRASFDKWSALGSVTLSSLRGNVSGVTTSGGVGSGFDAGQWVRPNEATQADGDLPGVNPLEVKLFVTGQVGWKVNAGINLAYYLGESITPYFQLDPALYQLVSKGLLVGTDSSKAFLWGRDSTYQNFLMSDVSGQTIWLEPRGTEHYASRLTIDLHAERPVSWRGLSLSVTGDLFNALGENSITEVRTRVFGYATDQQRRRCSMAPRNCGCRLGRCGSARASTFADRIDGRGHSDRSGAIGFVDAARRASNGSMARTASRIVADERRTLCPARRPPRSSSPSHRVRGARSGRARARSPWRTARSRRPWGAAILVLAMSGCW